MAHQIPHLTNQNEMIAGLDDLIQNAAKGRHRISEMW